MQFTLWSMERGEKFFTLTSAIRLVPFTFKMPPSVGQVVNIYRDSDIHCEMPFSSSRHYDLFHWDGSRFVVLESGTRRDWSVHPPIWYFLGVAPIITIFIGLSLLYLATRYTREEQ